MLFLRIEKSTYYRSQIWAATGRVIFFPINAPGMGRFKLFDLVGYSFKMIRVWVRVRIWYRVRDIVKVNVAVRVSKELGSG